MAKICRLAGLPNGCHQYIKRDDVVGALVNHHLVEIRKEMEPLKKTQENQEERHKTHARIHETEIS